MYKNHPHFCNHLNKVGQCMTHNWHCPDCGFGVGTAPPCRCADKQYFVKYDEDDPLFGTHIKEAIAVVKDVFRKRASD